MIKKLIIVTLCLIIFEVILFATGWDLFKPVDSICKIIMYSLCEIIICLYLYRILKKKKANLILIGILLVFALSICSCFERSLMGFADIVIFIPFYLLFCIIAAIYYRHELKKSIMIDMKIGLSLLISFAISLPFGLNVFFFKEGTHGLKFHDEKYEVWQADLHVPCVVGYMTEIRQVKGPFRKSIYMGLGREFETLENDKAIEDFLKSKVKSESSNKDQE